MADLVRELNDRGLKLGMATSCFPAACEAVLRLHGLRDYFQVIVYSDEVGRDKTFPDIYLICAQRLGVAPEDCMVFEDFTGAFPCLRSAGFFFYQPLRGPLPRAETADPALFGI
jgi:HAD superfamily hydrolase (TIGR01509 family)